eukprot:Trichotokara_eunicae@DN10631_c0_g1_i1.p1
MRDQLVQRGGDVENLIDCPEIAIPPKQELRKSPGRHEHIKIQTEPLQLSHKKEEDTSIFDQLKVGLTEIKNMASKLQPDLADPDDQAMLTYTTILSKLEDLVTIINDSATLRELKVSICELNKVAKAKG